MLHRRPSQMFMFDQGGANRWADSLNGGEVGLPTRRDWLGERGAGTGACLEWSGVTMEAGDGVRLTETNAGTSFFSFCWCLVDFKRVFSVCSLGRVSSDTTLSC